LPPLVHVNHLGNLAAVEFVAKCGVFYGRAEQPVDAVERGTVCGTVRTVPESDVFAQPGNRGSGRYCEGPQLEPAGAPYLG
jgi:hypothetical protein